MNVSIQMSRVHPLCCCQVTLGSYLNVHFSLSLSCIVGQLGYPSCLASQFQNSSFLSSEGERVVSTVILVAAVSRELYCSEHHFLLHASLLSSAWALESTLYLLCNWGCGTSKTSSQHFSSCSSHFPPGLIFISVHNQLWYLTWILQETPFASGFLSLSLLHGCVVCTENVKFPHVWLSLQQT